MADRGIRQAVDSVRNQAPAQPTQMPHPHAPPSSSSRPVHAMPSTSGRPGYPPFSHPISRSPSSSSLHRPPGSSLPSHRHHQSDGASQLPAWAVKAERAGVGDHQAHTRHVHVPHCFSPFSGGSLSAPVSSYLSDAHRRGLLSVRGPSPPVLQNSSKPLSSTVSQGNAKLRYGPGSASALFSLCSLHPVLLHGPALRSSHLRYLVSTSRR